jgi:nicotinamidase/pyrazinamidase
VPVINRLAGQFRHVVLTQDWHPEGHLSFASRHQGQAPFSEIQMPYGPQTLWPDHCTWESEGAAFRADLDIPQAELVIRKGFRREIDSYSAFFENDRTTPTGLLGYLRERGIGRVVCVGLAFDYCVRHSAEDAAAHGFDTIVIEEACRAIDLAGTAAQTKASFRDRGIKLT